MESAGQNRNMMGRLLILFIMLILYFAVFSFYGGKLFDQVFLADTVFDENTFIGPEKVDALTEKESAALLNEKIQSWQSQAVIKATYVEKEVEISNNLVSFQVNESVKQAADGRKNELIAVVSPEGLKEELATKMPALQANETIDVEMLARDLADIGDYLKSGESSIDLTLYLYEEKQIAKLTEVEASGLDEAAESFIKANPILPVKAGTSVSFTNWVEPSNGFISEESLNIMSSALYRIVLKSNFSIMEKNQSNSLPDYIELGYEAKVDPAKNQDLVYLNPNGNDYTISWSTDGGKLKGVMRGTPFYYSYKVEMKNEETLNPKTVLQFTPKLPYGDMRIEQYGRSGSMIDLYRNRFEGSRKVGSEQVAGDFYPPIHQIELYSSQEPPPPPPPEPEEEETTDDEEAEQADDAEENQSQSEEEESQSDEEDSTENGQ